MLVASIGSLDGYVLQFSRNFPSPIQHMCIILVEAIKKSTPRLPGAMSTNFKLSPREDSTIPVNHQR